MSLVNRLSGIGSAETTVKLPVSAFYGHLFEMAKGKRTRQNIIDFFELDAQEVTELDWLIAKYNSMPSATTKADFLQLIYVIFMLAEGKVPGYTTNAEVVARISGA